MESKAATIPHTEPGQPTGLGLAAAPRLPDEENYDEDPRDDNYEGEAQ